MTSTDHRQKVRSGLSPLYLPVYDALCSLLPEQWAPYCGYRSLEEQTILYAQGRLDQNPGKIITYAKAGESPHNYGCASDWIIWDGGTPIWINADHADWNTYEDSCLKVGALWGGNFRMRDNPHNELHIECDWKHVSTELNKNGIKAAQLFIHDRIVRK